MRSNIESDRNSRDASNSRFTRINGDANISRNISKSCGDFCSRDRNIRDALGVGWFTPN